jgi:hypothetical protein
MSLEFRLAVQGNLQSFYARSEEAVKRGMTAGMREATDTAKRRFRDKVRSIGLGDKVANTVRSEAYPKGARASLSPAGWLFLKAPYILTGHAGVTIRPNHAPTGTAKSAYLAIPTRNVPRRSRSLGLTRKGSQFAGVAEVEHRFNQDLEAVPGRNGTILLFARVVAAKNKQGFRSATKGRVGKNRKIERVLMFVLVPQVRLRKRIDIDASFAAAASDTTIIVARNVERELASARTSAGVE